MPIDVRVFNASDTLAKHEKTIQQTEALGFRLLSIATGFADSAPANLATFTEAADAPLTLISLERVARNLTDKQQEAQLNTSGKSVVCYGSLFINGSPQNVAALR